MSKLSKAFTFVTVIVSLSLVVFPVAAQLTPISDCSELGIQCTGNEDSQSLIETVTGYINAFLALVGVVASIYLVLGGVRYIMSEGEESKAEKAKGTILNAVIGIIVIGLAAIIVNFVIFVVSGRGGGGF
jgi:hypothetical protein